MLNRFYDDSTAIRDDDIGIHSSSLVHTLDVIKQRGQQLYLLVITGIAILVVDLFHEVIHVLVETLVSLVQGSKAMFVCSNMSLIIHIMSVADLASVVHLSLWFIEY